MNADVKSQTLEELQTQFQTWREPAYRLTQLLEWLYAQRATRWDSMSNLPRSLRDRLQKHYSLQTLALVQIEGSADTTYKFLWRLPDASLIESVLIPASPALYGDPSDRHTLCVSTQVGCAYGCKFCASGLEGWKRNLTVEEIVEQVLAVERWHVTQEPGPLTPSLSPSAGERMSARTGDGVVDGVKTRTIGSGGAPHEPPCSEGVPPASSPSVSLDEDPGGETPPELAAVDGCATPCRIKVIMRGKKTVETFHEPHQVDGPDARPMLKVEATQNLKSQISNLKSLPRLINNLVIMGMGEPLANYDNLLKALRILNAPWGCGIGARKITISTSGLAPQIRRLAGEPLQFRLAISLHGATDEVRNRIMPVNRKYPLKELIAACEYYQKQKGRRITLEYILIAGVNDSLVQAKPLAELANRLNAKINLIPYNQVEGLSWQRPAELVQETFLEALVQRQVLATLRREKGHDIDAACGQLRLKVERERRNALEAVPL